MEKALQTALEAHSTVSGFLVADCNGLLVTAQGELADKGYLAGRFTAMARKALTKVPFTNSDSSSPSTADGQVVVEKNESKQLVVKRVGEFTIASDTVDYKHVHNGLAEEGNLRHTQWLAVAGTVYD
eukprot:scaffold4415_cov170-Ochromonas_danica.AAC.3